jgi:hypothetical protein
MRRRVVLAISIVVLIISVAWIFAAPSYEPVLAALVALAGVIQSFTLPSHDDGHVSIRSRNRLTKLWRHLRFSFYEENFVHPLIVKDLLGWISDTGEQVISINLLDANKSNRYHGDFEASDATPPVVTWNGEHESFSYRYVGTSRSGVHILHVADWGGGSGIFHSLMLVTLEEDEGIEYRDGHLANKHRVLITHLGLLGDKFAGRVHYDGRKLRVMAGDSPSTAGVDRLELEVL